MNVLATSSSQFSVTDEPYWVFHWLPDCCESSPLCCSAASIPIKSRWWKAVVNTCAYNRRTLLSNDPYLHGDDVYSMEELCVLSTRASTARLCCMKKHMGKIQADRTEFLNSVSCKQLGNCKFHMYFIPSWNLLFYIDSELKHVSRAGAMWLKYPDIHVKLKGPLTSDYLRYHHVT